MINAASMYRELHKMSCPLITNVPPPVVKPVQTYVPKCDANFKVSNLHAGLDNCSSVLNKRYVKGTH